MIGICGISGIGKTTLAKAIYNLMYTYFEGRCFCEDFQEVEKRQGLTQVQMQMIGQILNIEDLKISSVGKGTMLIKRLACKRILLVLDNVNSVEQLEALAGSRCWFGPGSLIIFTGKEKQLLWSHKVNDIYEMEALNDCKALELFSLYAFGKRHPTKDFEILASQIVKYLQGHPLALKMLGRLLYDKSLYVWKSELDRLQSYPNSEIVQKLRPSFDSLASDEKRTFLDTACAFIGGNKDFAASVLDSSHCSANAIFEVLVDKFLIKVYADRLQMHELIQSMSREIIREDFRQNHRRLCISSEDYDVLNLNKVTEVEVLVLLLKENCPNFPIDGQALTRMKNLWLIKICFPKVKGRWQPFAVNFSGRLDSLSNKLRLLYWHGLPLKFLPSDFYPKNVVTIDLSYSHIKHIWTTPKPFKRLKFMKLRHCCNLTTTPDFSEITNLEELDLEGCVNLVTVHPSIGMLKRLVVLNMRDCRRARSFPSKVEMDSLQVLNLSGCLNVNQVPEAFWSRWSTSIPGFIWKQLHPQRSVSLEGLHILKSLNLSYCNLEQVPDAIGGLSCLERLNLKGNNLLELPESIGGLSCLKKLNLSGNNFTSLPGSLSQLSHLQELDVDGCKKLELLPELPPSVWNISAVDCTSLREVLGSYKYHMRNDFRFCPNLFKNVTIDSEGSTSKTECLDSCITSQGYIHQLFAFLGYVGFQTNRCEYFLRDTIYSDLDIAYHVNSMPEWFTNRSRENHVKVELPSDWSFDKFRGFGICVVFKYKKPFNRFKGYSVKNFDGTSQIESPDYIPHVIEEFLEREVTRIQDSYMIWLQYRRDTRKWKEAKNFVTFSFAENNEDVEVKEFGVRLICDEDIQQESLLSMLQGLPIPTQNGGGLSLDGVLWSW